MTNKLCLLVFKCQVVSPLMSFQLLSLSPYLSLSHPCSYRHWLRNTLGASVSFIAISYANASTRFYWMLWEAEYAGQQISEELHYALKNHGLSTGDSLLTNVIYFTEYVSMSRYLILFKGANEWDLVENRKCYICRLFKYTQVLSLTAFIDYRYFQTP